MTIIERKGQALKPAQLSVLLIDDQPFYCNLINEILRAMGVSRVEFAENGRAACEVLQSFMPNIITVSYTHLDVYKRQSQYNRHASSF